MSNELMNTNRSAIHYCSVLLWHFCDFSVTFNTSELLSSVSLVMPGEEWPLVLLGIWGYGL